MSYFAKLTGEDLSRYLNKIESIGLIKVNSANVMQIGDLTVTKLNYRPIATSKTTEGTTKTEKNL